MAIFSRHSLDRIKERGFSKESILTIVSKETDVIIYPSTRDTDIDLYFGKDGPKYLLVIFNKRTETIVTVRNMRKKEKNIFTEVIRNEEK
jgi:uncharacterized DUF497 family protein